MKKLFLVLTTLLFGISSYAAINTEFDLYARLQDSLMVNAYKKRDVNTQEKILEKFQNKYEKLSSLESQIPDLLLQFSLQFMLYVCITK